MKSFLLALFCCAAIGAASQSDDHFLDSLLARNQRLAGTPMVPFRVQTLDGKVLSESDLKGKVTLINFWFQYCAPCNAEMPALEALYRKYSLLPGFRMFTVTYDAPDTARAFLRKNGLSFPAAHLDRMQIDSLNYKNGFPTTLLIDGEGRIAFLETGGNLHPDKAAAHIEKDWYPKIEQLLAQLAAQ